MVLNRASQKSITDYVLGYEGDGIIYQNKGIWGKSLEHYELNGGISFDAILVQVKCSTQFKKKKKKTEGFYH